MKNEARCTARMSLVDTGEKSMTGGRLKRVQSYIYDEPFCFTYGDGLTDLNISHLISFHKKHGKEATLTAVQTPGRYGALDIGSKDYVQKFQEKPRGDGSWVNGGFFVLNKNVITRIDSDKTIWEAEPLHSLASDSELVAYKHDSFWQCMDTKRDKITLEEVIKNKKIKI